jgi:Tfp pilus assembly protein FimT
MIVVGIMALVLGMTIPFAKQVTRREGLTQAVWDVQAVCGEARKKAIFQGAMSDLVFHARDASMAVGSAGEAKPAEGGNAAPVVATGGPPPANQTAHFSDQVVIEVLKINGVDCMDMDSARVRFFPNGTCDDMTMVLSRTDRRDRTEIILEPTTGHTFIESDPTKFRSKL